MLKLCLMILIDESCCLHLRKDNNNNTKSDCTTFNLNTIVILIMLIDRLDVNSNTIVKIQHSWYRHTHYIHTHTYTYYILYTMLC